MRVAVISLARRTLQIDLNERDRVVTSSNAAIALANAELAKWLAWHYRATSEGMPPLECHDSTGTILLRKPSPPTLPLPPDVIGVHETGGRVIAETILRDIIPSRNRHGYWEVAPEIADKWYQLADIVRTTTGKANKGKGKTDDPATTERRKGQPLTAEEKTLYHRIIRELKKLPHAQSGKFDKVADKLGIDVAVVKKAAKWGRKHELI